MGIHTPGDAQPDELDVAIGVDRVPVVGFDAEVEGLFWCAGQGGIWHSNRTGDGTHGGRVGHARFSAGVLYGMGFKTESAPWLLSERERILAKEKIKEAAQYAKVLTSTLPGNRELLSKVRRFGFQKI